MKTTPLALVLLAVFLLCIASIGASPAVAADRPPNVVMIVGDDMGWTDFGFMGNKVIHTPRLDKLSAESAVFPNAYVPTSLCRASLATLLTGLYAHQHKICCNDPPDGVDRAAMHPFIKKAPALPRLLAGAGYRSFQTGKFWEGHFSNAGFTDGMTTKGRHGEEGLVIGRETMQPIFDFLAGVPPSGGRTPENNRRLKPELQRQPFFVWYAPMLPHEPHNPPDRLLRKYAIEGRNPKLAAYYAMCEWFDETCGQLLDYLDRHDLRENTLVVFVIDNGWIQETGEVRTTRGNFAPKSKLSPYDGGLRTPVMLCWPGYTRPGRYDDLVSTIDLAPTILSAAGLTSPKEMPGLNLLATAGGGPRLQRDAVYGEIFVHTAVDLEQPALNLTHRWIRAGDWKLITFAEPKVPSELYNVKSDPLEERNVASAEPERARALERRLDAWWQIDRR